MFNSGVDKAAKSITEMAMMPYQSLIQNVGLRQAFWCDRFAISFFGIMTAILIEVMYKGKFDARKKGIILQSVYQGVSGLNGNELAKSYTNFALNDPSDERFALGRVCGEMVTYALLNRADLICEIDLELGGKFKKDPDAGLVGIMQKYLFEPASSLD